jgi:ankyrin repeat protein
MIEDGLNSSALIVNIRVNSNEHNIDKFRESYLPEGEESKCPNYWDNWKITRIKQFFQTIYNNECSQFRSFFKNNRDSPWEWIDDEEGLNCLHRACYLNLTDFVNIIFEEMTILSQGKEILTKLVNKSSKKSLTAIHLAAYRGNIEIIKLLIKNGANIQAKNEKGLNVLHMAAQGDQPSALLFFTEKYDLHLEELDYLGNTPLHWACYTGSQSFVNILLSYRNLNVNLQEKQGLTPLHLAVMSEKTKIIKKLIYYGALLSIVDNKNRKPIDLAINKNKIKIAEMIKNEQSLIDYSKTFTGEHRLHSTKKSNCFIYTFLFLHIVLQSLTFFFILPHFQNNFIGYIYIILFVILISIHVIACVSNAGKISNPELAQIKQGYPNPDTKQCKYSRASHKLLLNLIENSASIEFYCPYCVVRSQGDAYIKHCFHCNVCIIGYDHHCDWINNCVGVNNIRIFIAFISYVLLNLLMHLLLTVYTLVFQHDVSEQVKSNTSFPPIFEFLRKYNFYEKNAKIILASCVMIICLCFLPPVIWLWNNNIKASFKSNSTINHHLQHKNRSYYCLFGNITVQKENYPTEEEEHLLKSNTRMIKHDDRL